jgi:hypothetical protein
MKDNQPQVLVQKFQANTLKEHLQDVLGRAAKQLSDLKAKGVPDDQAQERVMGYLIAPESSLNPPPINPEEWKKIQAWSRLQ